MSRPRKLFAGALAGVVLALTVAACGLFGGAGAQAPGLGPDASSAQVTADQVLQGLVTAWNAATPVCLSAEDAGALKAGSCAAVLLPAHDALEAAGASIDAWYQGSQGQFACAVAEVVEALVNVEAMLIDAGATVPSAIQQGLQLAQGLGAFCPDAGANLPGAPMPTFDAGGQ